MSRLRKNANNVSPFIHNEVEKQMTNPEANTSQVMLAQMDFVIAKRLLADLPIVPTNERVYELCQDIRIGLFEDLGGVETAEENWDAWKQRAREILEAKGVLVLKQATSRLRRVAERPKAKTEYDDNLAKKMNDYLSKEFDLGDGVPVAKALTSQQGSRYTNALAVVVCDEDPDMIETALKAKFGEYFFERISQYTIGVYDPNLGWG